MDAMSIADRIATELQARDDVATATVDPESTADAADVSVKTQGGKVYDVRVRPHV